MFLRALDRRESNWPDCPLLQEDVSEWCRWLCASSRLPRCPEQKLATYLCLPSPSPHNIIVVMANQQTTIILLKPGTRATTNILMWGGFRTEKPQISFRKNQRNLVRIRFCIYPYSTAGSHNNVILIYSVWRKKKIEYLTFLVTLYHCSMVSQHTALHQLISFVRTEA